jgi:hypothetical protein
MDKYTKTLLAVIKIPVGVFCILIGLAFIGVSVWVSTFSDIASMILIISLLGGGCLINYGVGYAFLGDEYKATHLVRNGRTVFAPIESAKFLKRRKLVTLVGVIAYIVLSVYYIARVIFVSIYAANHQNADIDTSPVALIAFAIVSLVFAFCLFMLYKKTKHIDLKEE